MRQAKEEKRGGTPEELEKIESKEERLFITYGKINKKTNENRRKL